MELSKKTKTYWEEKDWQDLNNVESVSDFYVIAKRIINRMPKNLVQVCGPIGTGGLGSKEANLNAFNETIKDLQRKGLNVFDQMPFEAPMQELKEKVMPNGEYFESILTDFYQPLFESSVIYKFCFMPNWQSSKGANWEHEKAKELNIEIVYL